MESQSFSVLPLWNYMQVGITAIPFLSSGVLSGNRRFHSIHSLLFWRLLHSKLALLQTQTERWTEIQPLSNILKCKWKELLYIKSWFKPMYSCCWKNTKLSETQHLIWVSRTAKTDCNTDVYCSTWSLGNWWSIENNYIRVLTYLAMSRSHLQINYCPGQSCWCGCSDLNALLQEASFRFGGELDNWKEKQSRVLPLFHPVTLFSNSILAPRLGTVYPVMTLVQESWYRLDQGIRAHPRVEALELSRGRCLCGLIHGKLDAGYKWNTTWELPAASGLKSSTGK